MKARIVSDATVHDAEFEQLPRAGDKVTVMDEHGDFQYEVTHIEHVVNHGTTEVWIRVKENQTRMSAQKSIDSKKLA
jgi:hypothetical protein